MKKKTKKKVRVRRGFVQKVIETPDILAILQVPVIFVPELPDEPLLDAAALKFLDEARRRARAGDKRWLKGKGAEVYVSTPAA